jgi:hypothetical protein
MAQLQSFELPLTQDELETLDPNNLGGGSTETPAARQHHTYNTTNPSVSLTLTWDDVSS